MTLKDLLTRKEGRNILGGSSRAAEGSLPEFTFMRTDTNSQEIIRPPFPRSEERPSLAADNPNPSKRPFRFRSSFSVSTTPKDARSERRLSSFLHLRNNSRVNSVNIPTGLPNIDGTNRGQEETEAQWEERATILAKENPILKHNGADGPTGTRPGRNRSISNAQGDDHIQEAIRLHEAGDFVASTAMFGRLADPNGGNNALSQVLYGLALRHGWGISRDPSLAITYLSQAASNSASVESQALSAGIKKGGAAKGELILAIYELANCFRYGWGVGKDPVAARKYYETAANLGDADAMNEAAWCYEEGFGGKKDKFAAARWYRLAEEKGNKTVGNSWIWKEKYNPKEPA